jgi:hypothetical protein
MRSQFASLVLLVALVTAAAHAQSPDANRDRARRAPLADTEDLEPAVDVGDRTPAAGRREVAVAPAASAASPRPSASTPAEPASRTIAPAESATSTETSRPAVAAVQPRASRAMDTLDLGTTSITGNQELPKVLYIVPWKKSDLGELVGRPVNTLLDEVLEPVDPEVFERHLSYYETLHKAEEE